MRGTVGHSPEITGLVASIIALLAMGVAVAQDATWKDCELGARNPDRSIAACSKILKRSSNAAALHHRGQAFAEKGKFDQAISDVSAGIRLDPQRADRWQERGELYARQDKYQQASADITEAIRRDPTPRAFRFQSRAEAYQGLGDLTRAIADYDEAIQLNPGDSFRFYARANTLRDAGQYGRALADYETALKLAPTNVRALLDGGLTYTRMGRSEAAKRDFDKALTLDPSNAELRRAIKVEVAELPGQSPSSTTQKPPQQSPQPQRTQWKIDVLQADLTLVIIFSLLILITAIVRAPRTFRDEPRDVLICCAHSDDCVITGAEYAYGSAQKGLSVNIVYLTCSAAQSETEVARTRRSEAFAAWSAFHVPERNLTFINLSQSPLGGPPVSYSDKELMYASKVLKQLFMSLPQHAAVIVPADGESHVDHRNIRRLALAAIIDSTRDDLIVYETPEYNNYLSFVHGPNKAIRTILRQVPPLGRFFEPYKSHPNYISGPPGLVFRDTPNRLLAKQTLLRGFRSQNGDRLAKNFGHQTLYRKIWLDTPSSHRFVSAFGAYCDASTLGLALVVFAQIFLLSYAVSSDLNRELGGVVPISYIVSFLGLAASVTYLMRRSRGTASVESMLFVWVGTLGAISGTF